MRFTPLATAFAALLLIPAGARAGTVSVSGGALTFAAAPGETNDVTVAPGTDPAAPAIEVSDPLVPLTPGAGCAADPETGGVACAAGGITQVRVSAGDGNDAVSVLVHLPGRIDGGRGDDVLAGGPGRDTVLGGGGDDTLEGGDGRDLLVGGTGKDALNGGLGADDLRSADHRADSVACGNLEGDRVRADVADAITGGCSRVSYAGPASRAGGVYSIAGGSRFVPVPGQFAAQVDRRILPDVLYLVRRYHVRVEEGYSLSSIHAAGGEHPLGLAVDLVPGPGGTWDDVDRLAHWAEPSQNHPRWPFRWVGYNGDYNHGRGNHLHLSWMHSLGRFGHPVYRAWVFAVSGGATASAAAAAVAPAATRGTAPERDR